MFMSHYATEVCKCPAQEHVIRTFPIVHYYLGHLPGVDPHEIRPRCLFPGFLESLLRAGPCQVTKVIVHVVLHCDYLLLDLEMF